MYEPASESDSPNTQHGAPSGNMRGSIVQWSFLRQNSAESLEQIVESNLRRLNVNVTPLGVFDCESKQALIEQYCSLVGYIGGKEASLGLKVLNPFLDPRDDDSVTVEELVGENHFPGKLTCLDVEGILRTFARASLDAVRATVFLLKVLSEHYVMGEIRRRIAKALEEDAEALNGWREYSGKDPSSFNQTEKTRAATRYKKFHAQIGRLLQSILDCLTEGEDETVVSNISQIDAWRTKSKYFKVAKTRKEVFERESILFSGISKIVGWGERRELLNALLNDSRMNVGSGQLDLHLLGLQKAESYSKWIVLATEAIEWTEARGIAMVGPKQTSKPLPVVKVDQEKPRDKCENCHKLGHNKSNCYRLRPHIPAEASTKDDKKCFNCGGLGHISKYCTVKPVVRGITGEVKTLAPPATDYRKPFNTTYAATPAPTAEPPTVTRFGRTIKKPVLNTQSEPQVDDPQTRHETCLRISPHCEEAEASMNSPDFVSCNSSPDEAVETPENSLPWVQARIEAADGGECKMMKALVDTGSTLNFVTFRALNSLGSQIRKVTNSNVLMMETMSGVSRTELQEISLLTSLCDSHGEWSLPRTMSFLIFEKDAIPGGYDMLLSSEVARECGLTLKASNQGYEISLNHVAPVDKSVQVGMHTSNVCGFVSGYDAEADEIADQFIEDDVEMAELMKGLPGKAVAMGPLKLEELRVASQGCAAIPVEITFRPGKEHPPIHELGFPSNDERHIKLMTLLQTLVDEEILKKVPRNSGVYVSPGFAVKKGADKVRLVVNLQALNHRLEFPPGIQYHNMREWMRNIPSWAEFYSVLDVKNAFYMLPLSSNSQKYMHMSIWTRQGYEEYAWQRCPQGFSAAPSWWTAHIERVLSSLKNFLAQSRFSDQFSRCLILAYADDILVCGRTEEATRAMSELIHQFLLFNKLYVPEEKFQRVSRSVQVMGFQLSSGGALSLNEENLEKMKRLKKPRTRKELNSALGLLNYVSFGFNDRLNLGKSKLNVLYELKDGKGIFRWESRHDEAWKILVEEFQNLKLYTWSTQPGVEETPHEMGLVLSTDASDVGTGFAAFVVPLHYLNDLEELDVQMLASDGVARLVCLGSRRFSGSERFYISFDKEGLGIYHCLMKCRPWILLVEKTVLLTDNTTAISRFRGEDKNANLTRGKRWLRWLSDCSDLLYGVRPVIIRHLAGAQNVLADHLSRFVLEDLCLDEAGTQTEPLAGDATVLTTVGDIQQPENPILSFEMQRALEAWDEDDRSEYVKRVRLSDIWRLLTDRIDEVGVHLDERARHSYVNVVRQTSSKFSVDNGVLYFEYKGHPVMVIPDSRMVGGDGSVRRLRYHVIKYFHEASVLASHRGEVQTLGQVRRSCWWPAMDRDIQKWVSSCEGCQLNKARSFHDYSSRLVNGVNQLLMVDWFGAQGKQILLMVDSFSHFTMALIYTSKSSENVVDGLLTWCSLMGAPARWGSDCDSTFVSKVTRELRGVLRIRDLLSPAHSPQTQGSVERKVGSIKECFERILLNDSESDISLELLVKAAVWAANASPVYGSFSSYELVFGRAPRCPLGVSLQGISDGLREDEDLDGYILRLKEKLAEIHAYWFSKSQEMRNRGIDNARDLPEGRDLTGLRCIRVSYKAQRREILDIVRVIRKVVDSHNTYVVTREGETQEILCSGYHLVPLVDSVERQELAAVDRVERAATPEEERLKAIRRELRLAEMGTWVACDHNHEGQIWIGEILEPPFADRILVRYLIPIEENKLRKPQSVIEAEEFTDSTPIADIIKVNVIVIETDGIYNIPLQQFGGSVV